MSGAKSLLLQSIKSPPDVKIVERDIPEAIPGTAVVRVLACNVGSTHGYLISHEIPGFTFPVPTVYGCNAVGRVVAVGSDAVTLKEDQLVLIDPFISARDDSNAEIIAGLMDGNDAKSRKLAADTWREGCWQTHTVIPLENAVPLDEDALLGKHGYRIEELPFIHRLCIGYGAVSNIGIKAGETVIVGPATGQFGGAAVEVASAVGARVIALGRNEETLARLRRTVPRVETVVITGDVEKDAQAIQAFGLADAYIDYTPHTVHNEPTHLKSAMLSLRKRGRVALMGGLTGDIALPYFLMILKSLEVKGKWMYTREEIRTLIKMVETGVMKIGEAAGHKVDGKYQLENYEAALEHAAKQSGWGSLVVLTP
ncbi:GroES-like protein [Poronia punctata]|nr:GroES-like protein [Poronia punctata]